MARDSELSCITVLDTVATQHSSKYDTVDSRSINQSFPSSHREIQDTPPRHGHYYTTPTSHSNQHWDTPPVPRPDTPPGSHVDTSSHKPMGNGVNYSGSDGGVLLEQHKNEVSHVMYMHTCTCTICTCIYA